MVVPTTRSLHTYGDNMAKLILQGPSQHHNRYSKDKLMVKPQKPYRSRYGEGELASNVQNSSPNCAFCGGRMQNYALWQ